MSKSLDDLILEKLKNKKCICGLLHHIQFFDRNYYGQCIKRNDIYDFDEISHGCLEHK